MLFDRCYRLIGFAALALTANVFVEPSEFSSAFTNVVFAADETMRTWTDSTGKFKVEAVLISNEDGKVRLRKKDKRVVELPFAKLSKKDQDYLASLDADPFAGGTLEDADDPADASEETSEKTVEKPRTVAGDIAVGGSVVNFPTLADVHVGDRSKIKSLSPASGCAWTLKPTRFAAREFSSRRAVILFQDKRVGKAFEASEPVILAPWSGDGSNYFYITYKTGILKNSKTFIERCDPEKGMSAIAQADGGELTFVDVSADGKYALAIVGVQPQHGGFAEKTVLGVYELGNFGPNATTSAVGYFCPYYTKPKLSLQRNAIPLEQAAWVDPEHALTCSREEVALWNLTTGAPEYAISTGVGARFILEPSRQYFALLTGGSVGFYDAKTGEALGTLDMSAVNKDKNGLRFAGAFSPDGLRFAVLSGDKLATYDLATGKCEHCITVDGSYSDLIWANNEMVLNGGQLYDLATGLPVCRYSNLPSNSKVAINYGGLVWTSCSSGFDRVQFFGTKLPHQKALDALKNMDMKENFDVYPGVAVAIKVETNKLLDEKEVREAIAERAKECGYTIDPKSKLTLLAKCSVDREENVEYGTSNSWAPVALPGQTNVMGSLKLKVFALQIALMSDKNKLWDFNSETTGPNGVKYDSSKKIEDTLRETNKPDAKFYRIAPLPRYVAKGGKAKEMLAELTPAGVK